MTEAKCMGHLVGYSVGVVENAPAGKAHTHIEELSRGCPARAGEPICAGHGVYVHHDHVHGILFFECRRLEESFAYVTTHFRQCPPECGRIVIRYSIRSRVAKRDWNWISCASPADDSSIAPACGWNTPEVL